MGTFRADQLERGKPREPRPGGLAGDAQRRPRTCCLERAGKILWYFAVGDRSVYPDDLKYYDVEHMASRFPDPYRHNTFGNLLESPELKLSRRRACRPGQVVRYPHSRLDHADAAGCETWIEAIQRQAAQPVDVGARTGRSIGPGGRSSGIAAGSWPRTTPLPAGSARTAARRSSPGRRREEEDGAALVAQSYNVFRFLMACQSRGRVQTKFNGGLFTQQLRVKADQRRGPKPTQQADGVLADPRGRPGCGAAGSPTRTSGCCTGRCWPAATSI